MNKAAFEKKFGKIVKPSVSSTTRVQSIVSVTENAEPTIVTTIPVLPTNEVAVISEEAPLVAIEDELATPVEAEILFTTSLKPLIFARKSWGDLQL
jgi:hypothetical protein